LKAVAHTLQWIDDSIARKVSTGEWVVS
jgi:hypothetical protein